MALPTQADACGSTAIECFRRLAHRCWPPLPTNRISCDVGSDDLLGDAPSGLLRVFDIKQSPADRLWLRVETPGHCHREKQQGFTSLHSAVSHSVNEVGKHIYK